MPVPFYFLQLQPASVAKLRVLTSKNNPVGKKTSIQRWMEVVRQLRNKVEKVVENANRINVEITTSFRRQLSAHNRGNVEYDVSTLWFRGLTTLMFPRWCNVRNLTWKRRRYPNADSICNFGLAFSVIFWRRLITSIQRSSDLVRQRRNNVRNEWTLRLRRRSDVNLLMWNRHWFWF